MRAHLGLGLLVSAILAAVGCSSEENAPAKSEGNPTPMASDQTQAPPAPATGPLAQVSCRYIIPKSAEGTKVTCFDLTVQENRRNAGATKTIKLHLARIKGQKPDGIPTIELIGGPGGGGDDIVGAIVAGAKDVLEAYGPILAKGDLVVLDQRGIGRSVPRLNCDGDPSMPGATAACKTALEALGIDLAAYDTIENADDVHDLKVALGVPKVDLHGISYGTRLAIEILKRHADDVHAAVIDGVMPPDVTVMGGFPIAMDGVLTHTFDACKADAKCNTTYPNLDATLTALKAKLTATPFKAKDPDTGHTYDYDWDAFMNDLIEQSYDEGTAARVPYWIHSLAAQTQDQFKATQQKAFDDDDAAWAAQMAEMAMNPLLAELDQAYQHTTAEDDAAMEMAQGMYNSVTCNDYGQHETIEKSKAAQAKIRPELRDDEELAGEFADCDVWPKRASDPTVQAAATFGGPVLVIGGDVDVATPVDWAKHAASSLPVHTFVEVPTGGHGQMDACGAGLKGAFFTDPSAKLDATCATNRTIQFYYEPPATTHALLRRPAFVATRPALTMQERLADRILAASKPTVITKAVNLLKNRHGK